MSSKHPPIHPNIPNCGSKLSWYLPRINLSTWSQNEPKDLFENMWCKNPKIYTNFKFLAILLVTFLGWLSDPFQWLSDLQLGDEKDTLNHLVRVIFNILKGYIMGI